MVKILLNRRNFLVTATALGVSGCVSAVISGGSYAYYERRRILAFFGAEKGTITMQNIDDAVERQVSALIQSSKEDGILLSLEELDKFRLTLRNTYINHAEFYEFVIKNDSISKSAE